jgi:hypothetical protein
MICDTEYEYDIDDVRELLSGEARVRSTPQGPIIVQGTRGQTSPSPFHVAAARTARELGNHWTHVATPEFRQAWQDADPTWASRRRDFQDAPTADFLLFATYHWCDRFWNIDQTIYEPAELPYDTVIVNPYTFTDDGETWWFTWALWPDCGNDPRHRWYAFQIDPACTKHGSPLPVFNTYLVATFHEWDEAEPDTPFPVTLHWPIKPGQRAWMFHRLRSACSFGPRTSVEQQRPL